MAREASACVSAIRVSDEPEAQWARLKYVLSQGVKRLTDEEYRDKIAALLREMTREDRAALCRNLS